uniref:Fibrinogen C-terminal domain-containing protein n=1 Tax=Plectus sambesii TaxID=2011161 RepID=A0A914V7M5_9BILA
MFALLLLAFFGFPPLPQAQTNVIDSADYPTRIPGQCGSDLSQFDCGNGSCIPVTLVRDCVINCPDGSDEECGEGQLLCDNNMPSPGGNGCGICVENTPTGVTACMDRRWAAVCEQENVFKCECTMNCVYPGWLLDGADDCGDGSDENPCIANRTNGCPTDAECVFNAKSLNHTCECRSGYIPFASLCIPSIGVTMATPSSPMPSVSPAVNGAKQQFIVHASWCDALKKNVDEPSGLTMTFDTCNLPMQCARHLLCDQDTDGGGWTTIQHKNGTGSFARTWLEYKDGFGNATNDDFWLGNELIHRLTSVRDYELLVVMKIPLSSNGHMIVKYGSFAIGDETDGYKLTVGAVSMIIGTNANDLLKSNGAQFSARDRGPSNLCARVYQSGWWFDAICSGGGNLNVPIGGEPSNPNLVGITWGGQEVSAVAMLIREKGFPIPPQKQESVLGALGVSVVHSARIVLLGLFVVVALAY